MQVSSSTSSSNNAPTSSTIKLERMTSQDDDSSSPLCEVDTSTITRYAPPPPLPSCPKTWSHEMYIGGLTREMSEVVLESLFVPFDVEYDTETHMPVINVHLNSRTLSPRGDGIIAFKSEEKLHEAVRTMDDIKIGDVRLRCRVMDAATRHFLSLQIYSPRSEWTCPRCGASGLSCWENRCTSCNFILDLWYYSNSSAWIYPDDWICHICFMTEPPNQRRCGNCRTPRKILRKNDDDDVKDNNNHTFDDFKNKSSASLQKT